MKRKLLLGIGCLWMLSVIAQPDPILMRINGKAVLRSEYELAYHKSCFLGESKRKLPGECIEQFIGFKLKVAAARAAGLDTTHTFREGLIRYRAQLAKSYLTDSVAETVSARQVYSQMKNDCRTAQVEVMHIFYSLPQTLSASRVRVVKMRADSIYEALMVIPQPDFAAFVREYSEDQRVLRVASLQMPEEFEKNVFSLQKGEISKPFLTPQGIHIVKLIDRKGILTFDEMRETIERSLGWQQGMNHRIENLVQKLKETYRYTPDEAGMEELWLKGETNRSLFTLNGQVYSGASFRRFAAAYPRGIKGQFDAFVAKTILDCENAQLEQKYPAFCLLIQEHIERTLLTEISNREVKQKAATDEVGLSIYFQSHSSNYRWEQPRYKGVVLQCADKTAARQAKKMIKHLPENEWADAVQKVFNTSSNERIRVEQGVFSEGDNKLIDKLIFKKGDFESSKSYPFTVVWGKKQKGPERYQEVRQLLIADYQDFLDALWVKRLRAIAKVEINQEVLKTVNNH